MEIKLRCWHCQKTVAIDADSAPQFAFQIAELAAKIGWYGYADLRYDRVLVFCSKEHADAERTKAGHFRLRHK